MKIRIKFSKSGNMKFIGHLDTMRYFQKAMRRAEIDIAYSTGFSPHQIMSFAAPLGVGITSEGELDYRKLPDQAKTAMSIVSCADYILTYREGYACDKTLQELSEAVHVFYEVPEKIEITKKTKKSEKIIDLKQLIYDFQVLEADHQPAFYLKLSTGSSDNIKPELVMEHFYKFLNMELKDFTFKIHRKDVYSGSLTDGFISLNDMGEVLS